MYCMISLDKFTSEKTMTKDKPQPIKSTIKTKASKRLQEELDEELSEETEELSMEQLKSRGLCEKRN